MLVLLLPKVLAWVLGLKHPEYRRLHGGTVGFAANILLEIAFSTLIAPILMFFHFRFVVATLSGKGIRWNTQSRDAQGLRWKEVLPPLFPCVLLGAASLAFSFNVFGAGFLWTLPVVLGWLLSPILVRYTSRTLEEGDLTLATPTDREPTPVLAALAGGLTHASLASGFTDKLTVAPGLVSALVDPYVNAIHLTLLRESHGAPEADLSLSRDLDTEAFFQTDPSKLSRDQQLALLSDLARVRRLHHRVWRLGPEALHPVWRNAMEHYALPPAT
jgi:membrane glycosyltransferase